MAINSKNRDFLTVVGANHRSSTMVFRDQIALRNEHLGLFLDRLKDSGFGEAVVVSNSDRTEIYVGQAFFPDDAAKVIKLLSAQSGVGRAEVDAQTYTSGGRDAVRHLLSVCGTLDGLVIGDPRPADELKLAADIARQRNMVGRTLEEALGGAFRSATRIRRETEIGRRPVSIPAAAVQVAKDLHEHLGRCSGLLVGAGEMGELLATSFLSAGLKNLIVVHPLTGKADALAQKLNCHVGDMASLPEQMAKSDLVLTSMNSRRFALSAELVKEALLKRRRKPIFLIDTGVPGDIDHTVDDLEDAYLYSLDDLERVTREGWESRELEAESAWAIVDEETDRLVGILADMLPTEDIGASTPDEMEQARQDALEAANGDADKATKLLLERLKDGAGLDQ